MAAGAIIAIFIAMLLTRRKYKYDFVDYTFNLIWVFLMAMAGAKLLYLIVELKAFIANPSLFVKFIGGGGVFYGGLIGAMIGTFISSRIRRWNYIAVMDTLVAPICIAHSFGRVGCFMAGCCYGMETDSIFGVEFPEGGLAPVGVKVLPTQLFEACILFILGLVLLLIIWKSPKTGIAAGLYLTVYPAWRFFIEFFRADRRGEVGSLSTSQFISIFIFVAGLTILIFRKPLTAFFEKQTLRPKKQKKTAGDIAGDKDEADDKNTADNVDGTEGINIACDIDDAEDKNAVGGKDGTGEKV